MRCPEMARNVFPGRDRALARELVEELRRFARGESYDEQAMPELDSEALDFRAASELFAPMHKLKRRLTQRELREKRECRRD